MKINDFKTLNLNELGVVIGGGKWTKDSYLNTCIVGLMEQLFQEQLNIGRLVRAH